MRRQNRCHLLLLRPEALPLQRHCYSSNRQMGAIHHSNPNHQTNTTMKPTHTCPDHSAEFIGSCQSAGKTTDYWAHTFRDIGEIYLFAVTDDSGSFATITLPYSKDNTEPPMRTMAQWIIWDQQDDEGNKLKMPAPSSSWYPGMHEIAFKWLWKHLYPTSRGSQACGFQVHSKAECHSRWVFKAHQMLKKAGLELTDEQFEILLPPIDY